MAPKKDKGKSEAQKGGTTFTEVEKTFLELQITECNRIIARLRAAVDDYEVRNEELQKAYEKLDEDRADIISYLKKTLSLKNEENNELKDKVKGLEETREIETTQFNEKVAELEKNFTVMKDQLSSENKLLAGKLNTLEEFRAIRDDLMIKYETQEQAFKDQEMKYKRIIYDTEKKFVISKDKLKKEMEGRLLKLAQDFQDATELRVAASTHRVIRENIALSTTLDDILNVQAKLSEQNEKIQERDKASRLAKELAEEERDKAIDKNIDQLKVIDQLTTAYQDMTKERAICEKKEHECEVIEAKLQRLTKVNENLSLQVLILQQNLHASMSDQNKSVTESSRIVKENAIIKNILKEAAFAVQAALKLEQWAETDPIHETADRKSLLSRLLEILTQYSEIKHMESIDSLTSFGKIYEEGDLGFVPRPTTRKSTSLQSKESVIAVEKSLSSIASSTLGSTKTIPSLKVLQENTERKLVALDSLTSFMSSKSTESSTSKKEEDEESLTSIGKKLAASKLEIQKSILKDLAYSQTILSSQMKLAKDEEYNVKSVTITEGGQETVESEHVGEGTAEEIDDEEKEEKIEDTKEDAAD